MEQKNLRKELEARIIAKALKDEAFRKELISHPKEALASIFGVNIPETVQVKIVEEGENEVCLIIPHKTEQLGEIPESELEAVSGGAWSEATVGECGIYSCQESCNPYC